MAKYLTVIYLAFVATLLAVGPPARAETGAPTAVRVRVAHLAPFAGSGSATVAVRVGGATVGNTMAYGDRSDYQALAVAPGDHQIEVLRNGEVVVDTTANLLDGDTSIVVIGDETQVPLAVQVVNENLADPGVGEVGLRIIHVAAIGATIEATRVDVCNEAGQSFNGSAEGLRYGRATSYRILPAGDYDLKVSRRNDVPCTGEVVIDPPPITLAEGTETSLFLVGDGANQPLRVFTFADGLIGGGPVIRTLYLPMLAGSQGD